MMQNYISCLIGILLALNGESRSCNLEGTSYICNGISDIRNIPASVPNFVQRVTLIGTSDLSGSFPNGLFHDISWMNVTELSLLEFTSIDSIDKSVLDGLKNLRYLSISTWPSLGFIHPDVLHSIPDLEALYLDGDRNLKLFVVENVLTDKAEKLKYLSLRYLQLDANVLSFLGKTFFNALRGKELIYLDISYANIAGLSFNAIQDAAAFYHLRYLNISHSKIPWLGISHKSTIVYSLPNLQVLDVSGCETVLTLVSTEISVNFTCDFPKELKYYFAADVVITEKPIRLNYEIQVSDCDCKNLKIWDFSSNHISHVSFTKTEPLCFQGLLKVDLSKNGLEYISPSVLSSFPSLKFIDLSENQLHKMQDMDDFGNLLQGNVQLEVLLLKRNHLSTIPTDFLSSNTELLLFDLRENVLTNFNVELSKIMNLKYIDLRINRFGGLPSKIYQTLEVIYEHQVKGKETNISYLNECLYLQSLEITNIGEQYRYNDNLSRNLSLVVNCTIIPQNMKIDFSDNPLECNCDNVGFLKWAFTTEIGLASRNTLSCRYGDTNYLLDNELHQRAEYDCQLSATIIKATSSTLSVIMSLIIAALLVRHIHRKRQEEKDIKNLKKEIHKCQKYFKYIAFIPFSSHDKDFVETFVLHALSNNIKMKLDIEQDVLSTGNDCFTPGKLVIDEIHRCIGESLVVVPIITPAFIQSEWSQTECIVAIEKHRKMLILMEEQTDTKQAMTAIQYLIKNYTRATWSNKNGQFVIRPSWDVICDRIIALAAETLRSQIRKRGHGVDALIPFREGNPM
ncbi:hypothetical protein CHS0354_019574 [Potamilus streckersoni]|uniref:TIR domain-containing protein n=1 Tax=Potamilus streckersoni TaxID=2493646 RepID=A0AAE0TFQ3_9BIVA|nr:hypothetical protein CHS0354_019574 [Potamilus streckersoni]